MVAVMGSHIIDGKFQSDKYPTCPPGKVPLSVKDTSAQDLLWEYAQRRRAKDAEFSEDLEACLRWEGYEPPVNELEDLFERAYWDFDAARKAKDGPSERDAFKARLRASLDRVLRASVKDGELKFEVSLSISEEDRPVKISAKEREVLRDVLDRRLDDFDSSVPGRLGCCIITPKVT